MESLSQKPNVWPDTVRRLILLLFILAAGYVGRLFGPSFFWVGLSIGIVSAFCYDRYAREEVSVELRSAVAITLGTIATIIISEAARQNLGPYYELLGPLGGTLAASLVAGQRSRRTAFMLFVLVSNVLVWLIFQFLTYG